MGETNLISLPGRREFRLLPAEAWAEGWQPGPEGQQSGLPGATQPPGGRGDGRAHVQSRGARLEPPEDILDS